MHFIFSSHSYPLLTLHNPDCERLDVPSTFAKCATVLPAVHDPQIFGTERLVSFGGTTAPTYTSAPVTFSAVLLQPDGTFQCKSYEHERPGPHLIALPRLLALSYLYTPVNVGERIAAETSSAKAIRRRKILHRTSYCHLVTLPYAIQIAANDVMDTYTSSFWHVSSPLPSPKMLARAQVSECERMLRDHLGQQLDLTEYFRGLLEEKAIAPTETPAANLLITFEELMLLYRPLHLPPS